MLKILVIEDDESIRKILGWVLDSLNHQGVLLSTGEEALADPHLASAEFSVLLVDLSLPGMNGEEFVQRWIARLPLEARKPDIIFCSALQEGDLRASAAQLHLTNYKDRIHFLRKPFRIEELDRLLNRVEESQKQPAQAA